jgi:hypothetical protein
MTVRADRVSKGSARMTDEARSAEACPECGAHRLAVLSFPEETSADDTAPQAVLGGSLATVDEAPAIGCLACGAQWPDLEAFRAAQAPR